MNTHYTFGMIGLGTMGRNLLLNVADNGFSVLGFDKDPEKGRLLEESATSGTTVKSVQTLEALVAGLEKPRKIMMLVPAGKPVDMVLEEISPLLEDGDILIDGKGSGIYWKEEFNKNNLDDLLQAFLKTLDEYQRD